MKTIKKITDKLINAGATQSNLTTAISKLKKENRIFANERKEKILERIIKHEQAQGAKAEAKRIKAFCKDHGITQKEYPGLIQNAREMLNTLNDGYKMGSIKRLKVNGKLFFRQDTTERYSGKYSGSETHGSITVNLTKKAMRSLTIAGHVATIIYDPKAKISKCKFLTQCGQYGNHEIIWKDGYITGGHHAHDVQEAKQWRKDEAERLISNRKFKIKQANAKNKYVGFQHSHKVGNCDIGTLNFCEKYGLNPEFGYQIGYILSLENSSYTRKLLNL